MKEENQTSGVDTVQPPPATAVVTAAIEFVMCDCCGLTEECTETYIRKVRERNQGRWICGLCTEAVKDEIIRSSEEERRRIGNEEALNRHMSFCKSFRCSSPPRKEELISAMKQLLLRSLDSPPMPPRTSQVRKVGSVYGRSVSLPINVRSERCCSDR